MDTQDLLKRAAITYDQGNMDQAKAMLDDLLRQESENVQAWLLLAEVVAKPMEKLDCLSRVIAIDSNNEDAFQEASAAIHLLFEQKILHAEEKLNSEERILKEITQTRDLVEGEMKVKVARARLNELKGKDARASDWKGIEEAVHNAGPLTGDGILSIFKELVESETSVKEYWLTPSKYNLALPVELKFPPSFTVLPAKVDPVYTSEVAEIISHTLVALFAGGFIRMHILVDPGDEEVCIEFKQSATDSQHPCISDLERAMIHQMPPADPDDSENSDEGIEPLNLVTALLNNRQENDPGQTIVNRVVNSVEEKGLGQIKQRSWLESLLVEPNNEIEWMPGVHEGLMQERGVVKEIYARLLLMVPGFDDKIKTQISSGIFACTTKKNY